MALSPVVVAHAFRRAGGQCECIRLRCGHVGRCPVPLRWEDRDVVDDRGWHAHEVTALTSGGRDTIENYEVLCGSCWRQAHRHA